METKQPRSEGFGGIVVIDDVSRLIETVRNLEVDDCAPQFSEGQRGDVERLVRISSGCDKAAAHITAIAIYGENK